MSNLRHLRLVDLIPAVAFLTSSTAVQVLVAFAANLVLVRLLTPEEFGRFALVFAGAQLAFSILTMRINVLIIRTADAQFTEARRTLYASAITIESAFALLVALAWSSLFDGAGPWDLLLVLSVGISHWLNQNKGFYERKMPYRRLALIEMLAAAAAHCLSVVLAVSGAGVLALYLREVFLVAANTVGLWLVGGITWLPLRLPSRAEVRRLVAEVRGVWLDSMLEASFYRLNILVTGALLGERGAGLLFQAQRLAVVPHQFLTPLVARIAPNWFGRLEENRRQVEGRRRLLLLLSPPLVAGALVTALFAEPMVGLVFGDQWRDAAPAFAALAGMVLFLSLFDAIRGYCLSAARTRVLFGARVAQYALYGAILAPMLLGGQPVLSQVGLALSGAFAGAFLVGEGLLRWNERKLKCAASPA